MAASIERGASRLGDGAHCGEARPRPAASGAQTRCLGTARATLLHSVQQHSEAATIPTNRPRRSQPGIQRQRSVQGAVDETSNARLRGCAIAIESTMRVDTRTLSGDYCGGNEMHAPTRQGKDMVQDCFTKGPRPCVRSLRSLLVEDLGVSDGHPSPRHSPFPRPAVSITSFPFARTCLGSLPRAETVGCVVPGL